MARLSDTTKVKRSFTWREWVDTALAAPTNPEIDARKPEKDQTGSDTWAGGSFSEAITLASDGWRASIQECERVAKRIAVEATADVLGNVQRSKIGVTGTRLHIGRYLSGDPECIIRRKATQISKRGRAVRLLVPICYSADVDESLVRARGHAIVALMDCLAANQHPLEVWASMAIHSYSNTRLAYAIEVQRSNHPMNIARIMYGCGHPTMLRRLAFAVEECESRETMDEFNIGGGYGTASYAARETDLDHAEHGTTIVLAPLEAMDEWRDESWSATWVAEQVERLAT